MVRFPIGEMLGEAEKMTGGFEVLVYCPKTLPIASMAASAGGVVSTTNDCVAITPWESVAMTL
jgi:hypothetical protein